MVKFHLVNFEIVDTKKQEQIKQYIEQKIQYFNELFKRYPTDVDFEFKFQKKSSGWKVDAIVEMQSSTLFFEESGKDLKKVLSTIFNKMKNQVKKQKAIERKDYEYKRAKYRKKKLTQKMFELLIEYHDRGEKEQFNNLLKDVYDDLQLDLKENFIAKGKTQEEAEKISQELMEKIKEEVYKTFTANKEQREEFLDSISDISHYYEKNY